MTYKQSVILLMLAIYTSIAQARIGTEYRFEIIIFEYTGNQNTSTESWPADPGYPDYSNAIFSISGSKKYAASSQNPAINFRLLPSSQHILKKQAGIIRQSSSRKLLLHAAWTQSMQSKRNAYPVSVKIGKAFNTAATSYRDTEFGDSASRSASPATLRQIEGTIKISIGRYLHVWTDLLHNSPAGYSAGMAGVQTHRYKDHRRMRSKELHYIDNPDFGILIYALPVK